MKNFNIEYCDKSKDIMILDIENERFLINPSTFDGSFYHNCKKINSNDNKPYIIKEIRWGGIIGYEIMEQSYTYKEKIYDFYEMYDDKRDNYVLRLKDEYFVFSDDDFLDNDMIYAHKVNSKLVYILSNEIKNGESISYTIESIQQNI